MLKKCSIHFDNQGVNILDSEDASNATDKQNKPADKVADNKAADQSAVKQTASAKQPDEHKRPLIADKPSDNADKVDTSKKKSASVAPIIITKPGQFPIDETCAEDETESVSKSSADKKSAKPISGDSNVPSKRSENVPVDSSSNEAKPSNHKGLIYVDIASSCQLELLLT